MNAFNVAEFNAGLHYATPEIFLGVAACVILMLDLFVPEAQRRWSGPLAIAALIVLAVIAKIRAMVKAEMPEGYEDSTGFHIGHK